MKPKLIHHIIKRTKLEGFENTYHTFIYSYSSIEVLLEDMKRLDKERLEKKQRATFEVVQSIIMSEVGYET